MLNANHDVADFDNAISDWEQRTQKAATDQIHLVAEEYRNIGHALPAAQPTLLTSLQSIGNFVSSVMSSVVNFFRSLFNTAVRAIQAAVEWLAKAAQSVADWVRGALHTISDALDSLF